MFHNLHQEHRLKRVRVLKNVSKTTSKI